MQTIRLRARVGPDSEWEWIEKPPELPEGEVEVILLYEEERDGAGPSPLEWPVLDGGRYLGGALTREEIYEDNGG